MTPTAIAAQSSQGSSATVVKLIVLGRGSSTAAPSQASDYLRFDNAMAYKQPGPVAHIADRDHDSDRVRKTIEARNVVPPIQMRKTRRQRIVVDRNRYRLRNLVERIDNVLQG